MPRLTEELIDPGQIPSATKALERWWDFIEGLKDKGLTISQRPKMDEPRLPTENVYDLPEREYVEVYQRYVAWNEYTLATLAEVKAQRTLLSERMDRAKNMLFKMKRPDHSTLADTNRDVDNHELIQEFGEVKAEIDAQIELWRSRADLLHDTITFLSRVITIKLGDNLPDASRKGPFKPAGRRMGWGD